MSQSLIYILLLADFVLGHNFLYPTESIRYEGSDCVSSVGLRGTCRRFADCQSRTIINNDLCSSAFNVPIYCCPNAFEDKVRVGNPTPTLLAYSSAQLNSLRPIMAICEHYHPKKPQWPLYFVGGNRTLSNEQPHMAAIGWPNLVGGIYWGCGGSVVTSNFILTAAHCTSLGGVSPSVARTGDLHLFVTENNTFPEDFQITNVYVHPEYKEDQYYHDIALLKISPDFGMRGLLPACIWPNFEIPENQLQGLGYGTVEYGGLWTNELFQGFLNYLPNENCTEVVSASPDIPIGVIRSQLCAYDPQGEIDTCQGDSGGPLQFIHYGSNRAKYMIVGITSFGENCAGITPGVYTRVSEYIDWIEPILLSDFHNKTVENN